MYADRSLGLTGLVHALTSLLSLASVVVLLIMPPHRILVHVCIPLLPAQLVRVVPAPPSTG